MGMFGGDFLGDAINGHPVQAITGSNSKLTQALDGQPASALGFGNSNDRTSSSGAAAPVAASAPMTSGSGGADGITPAAAAGVGAALLNANNNNQSVNPLAQPSTAPTIPTNTNPLQSPQAGAAPNASGTMFDQNAAPAVMARVQHPQFQSFLQSLGSYQ